MTRTQTLSDEDRKDLDLRFSNHRRRYCRLMFAVDIDDNTVTEESNTFIEYVDFDPKALIDYKSGSWSLDANCTVMTRLAIAYGIPAFVVEYCGHPSPAGWRFTVWRISVPSGTSKPFPKDLRATQESYYTDAEFEKFLHWIRGLTCCGTGFERP